MASKIAWPQSRARRAIASETSGTIILCACVTAAIGLGFWMTPTAFQSKSNASAAPHVSAAANDSRGPSLQGQLVSISDEPCRTYSFSGNAGVPAFTRTSCSVRRVD